MTLYLLLLVALLGAFVFFYLSFEKEKKKILLQARALKQRENKLKEMLKKEEHSHKATREKLQLTQKKPKKPEAAKNSGKKESPQKIVVAHETEAFQAEKEKLARKAEYLEEQVSALTEQLKEKNEEAKTLKESLKKETAAAEKSLEQSLLQLREEQGKLKEKAQEQKKKNNKALLEMKLEKKSIEQKTELELKRIKKKLKHYQQFYAMSINQKDMLEDKIKNWEKALKILASWVLKKDPQEAPMGELVASALEHIGSGSLVEDEFNFKPQVKESVNQKENNV